MPENKSFTPWNTTRIINSANNIGPNTTVIIQRILESVEHHGQGYNACLAVLRLERKYGMDRVERAGELALKAGYYSPRYKQLEPILKTNQDKIVKDSLDSLNHVEPSGYVRGSNFYKGC